MIFEPLRLLGQLILECQQTQNKVHVTHGSDKTSVLVTSLQYWIYLSSHYTASNIFISSRIFSTPASLEASPLLISSIPFGVFLVSYAPAPRVALAVITNSPSLNIAGISSEVPVPGPIDSPPLTHVELLHHYRTAGCEFKSAWSWS